MRFSKVVGVLLLFMLSTPSALAGGLESFLQNVDIQARADMNGFSAKVSAQFGVPEAQVKVVLGQVNNSPADAFMVFQLGQMANKQPDVVVRTYQTSRDRGWGVLAQQLGIRPGSPEFHALKRGDLHFGPGGQTYGSGGNSGGSDNAGGSGNSSGPGNSGGHGRGHGHGRGNN